MSDHYHMPDKSLRKCKYWWFDAWDWLVNSAIRYMGPSEISLSREELAMDPHIHTLYSHCSISQPQQIIRRSVKLGFNAVAIMDHDDITGALDTVCCAEYLKNEGIIPRDFLVIPGTEINSKAGHIGALFVEENFPAGLSPAETVRMIHEAGGLAIAVHPYHSTGIKEAVFDAPFDAVEVECGSVFCRYSAKSSVDLTSDPRLKNMAKLGASDAHYIQAIGSCYTILGTNKPTLESVKQAIIDGQSTAKTSMSCIRIRKMLGRFHKLG